MLGGAYSLAFWISPEPLLKRYTSSPSPWHIYLAKVRATVYLSLSVMVAFTIFPDQLGSNNFHAVAFGIVPWVLQALRSLLVDKDQDAPLEIPLSNILSSLILSPPIVYGCLNEMPYAGILFGAFLLINGISSAVSPETHSKAWGDLRKKDNESETSMRALGFGLSSLGIFILSLLRLEVSPERAYAYSLVPMVVSPFMRILDSDSTQKYKVLAWVPLVASVVLFNLFD